MIPATIFSIEFRVPANAPMPSLPPLECPTPKELGGVPRNRGFEKMLEVGVVGPEALDTPSAAAIAAA